MITLVAAMSAVTLSPALMVTLFEAARSSPWYKFWVYVPAGSWGPVNSPVDESA